MDMMVCQPSAPQEGTPGVVMLCYYFYSLLPPSAFWSSWISLDPEAKIHALCYFSECLSTQNHSIFILDGSSYSMGKSFLSVSML
jgi:hypothetical protein